MTLFNNHAFSHFTLPNRIAMAPMTRSRTTQPGNIPNAMMAEYYAQRASAGLIVTEATQISPQGQGYSFTPGIHSQAQIDGWKLITDAVHAKGGRIFVQLWHVGRMSHESFHEDGLPVAPSALNPDARVWIVDEHGQGAMQPCPTPRALTKEEIPGIVNDYRQAAINAMAAGFDGVEIHSANGYLLDQFLRSTSNKREDEFGGTIENRARLLLQVANAITGAIGADKVGVRLAPFITARGMNCPEIQDTILYAAKQLDELGIEYLHLAEADWDDAPVVPEIFRQTLRSLFNQSIIVAGGYSQQSAEHILQQDYADLVAFGRPFIANPDLPKRFKHGLALAQLNGDALFGGTEKGYSDYPNYMEQPA